MEGWSRVMKGWAEDGGLGSGELGGEGLKGLGGGVVKIWSGVGLG